MIAVPMRVAVTEQAIPASVATENAGVRVTLGAAYSAVSGDPYEGAYTVTPTQEAQVLATAGKVMLEDVTIDPIPQNYGLVTWNGSVLTVS